MNLLNTPVSRPGQWQDTNQGPNLLILHLGPGLTSLPLQYDLDVANNTYHRDSMKGQVPDPTNALVVHPGPPRATILNLDATAQTYHHDSLSGQVADPTNALIAIGILTNPGQPGAFVVNPVFTNRLVQDTNQPPNLVINLINVGSKPFIPNFLDDHLKRKDSLSGQYLRVTSYLPQPEPIVQNELNTFVSRLKTAQEPFIFPNVVILGVPAVALPPVQRQSEDFTYKRQQAQATYDFPNLIAANLRLTSPFVQSTFPDLQYKTHEAQSPFDFPNLVIRIQGPPPAVRLNLDANNQAYHKDTQSGQIGPPKNPFLPPDLTVNPGLPGAFVINPVFAKRDAQDTNQFYNLLALPPPLPPVTGFRVIAVQPGTYGGIYREIGDVFDLTFASDYSAYNVNYGPNSATQQFGWMMQVPPTTPLFLAATAQPLPLRPVSDPIPPVRFVY